MKKAPNSVKLKRDAIELALERDLDLIEVAPNARPPVCRLGDHGKLVYERQKRERKQRRNQVTVTVKEIKLTPKSQSMISR